MTAPHHDSLEYRPDVDGLRAIAVLLVVGYHAFPSAVPAGFVGVDVFFVISGYLISSIVMRDLATDRFTFVGFYAKRCRRIVPALLVVLAATWVLGWFTLLAAELQNLGLHILAGATFTSNILLWLEVGYFDTASELKPLLHLWSLGVEEQFYLLWPPLLVLARRYRLNLGVVIGGLFVLSLGLNLGTVHRDPSSAFYLLPARFWELLLGCALAYRETRHKEVEARLGNGLSMIGAVLLAVTLFVIDDSQEFPGWRALLPTLATLSFIAAGPRALFNRALSDSRLVFVGLVSYPFYLWHWPLLSLAAVAEEGTPAPAVRAIAALVAFVAAVVTWVAVERPVRKRLFASLSAVGRARAYVAAGVVGLACTGVVGLTTYRSDGFTARLGGLNETVAQMQWNNGGATRCRERYGTDGICWATKPEPRVILWGESHAEMLLPGLASTPSTEQSSIVLLGHYGCPPLLDIELVYGDLSQECRTKVDGDRDIIAKDLASAAIVILASRGVIYLTGQGYGVELEQNQAPLELVSHHDDESGLAMPQLFVAGYSRTISFLESLDKQVVFVVDIPELGFLPTECVDVRPVRLSSKVVRDPCSVPRATVDERQAQYREAVAELKRRHPSLAVFDPTSLLCDDRFCRGVLQDKVLYRDDDHLGSAGSKIVAEALVAWLAGIPAQTAYTGSP